MEWMFAVAGVAAGLLIGIWLGRASSSAKQLGEELKQTKDELDAYRGKVTQHFVRTAELVDVLAANSRDIYQHLASGSQELCNSDAVRLSDTVLKSLPDTAGEEAKQTVEIKAAVQEPLAEAVKGDGEGHQEATVQQDEPAQSAEKQADATPSNSQWSEVMPEVEERKEPARFH